jgi:hypothetical protein
MSTHSCRQLRAQLKSQEDAVKQLSEMLDEDKKRAAAELQVSVCLSVYLSEYAYMLDRSDTLNLQVLVCLSNLRMSVCLCKYACWLDKGTKTDTAGVCPLSMSRLSVSV